MAAEVDRALGGLHAGGESGDIHVQEHEDGDRHESRERPQTAEFHRLPQHVRILPVSFLIKT